MVGCEGPPDCIARRATATTATIATAAIIARFLFGLMGRGWRYGKNLFAMFNSGCIDAVGHSLRHNSYECYLCLAVVGKLSSLGVLPCLSKTPPLAPAGRGGLSGPGSRWLRGPGLRPVGASGPLLGWRIRAAGRGSPAPPRVADSWAGPAPRPGGGASP